MLTLLRRAPQLGNLPQTQGIFPTTQKEGGAMLSIRYGAAMSVFSGGNIPLRSRVRNSPRVQMGVPVRRYDRAMRSGE